MERWGHIFLSPLSSHPNEGFMPKRAREEPSEGRRVDDATSTKAAQLATAKEVSA
jgi:hypothetical protein